MRKSNTNHHLLNHSSEIGRQDSDTPRLSKIDRPCLAIEITEFAVLRLDLPRVDLGMVSKDVLPPLYLVHFLEVEINK